jgi:hypothetical protein
MLEQITLFLRDCICVKTGTDATGDVLTYTWEQNDAAVTSSGDKVWLLLQNLMVLCFDLYILVLVL